MAVAGTMLKALGGVRYDTVSTFVYLAMGWLVVIAGTACHFVAVRWYAA